MKYEKSRKGTITNMKFGHSGTSVGFLNLYLCRNLIICLLYDNFTLHVILLKIRAA